MSNFFLIDLEFHVASSQGLEQLGYLPLFKLKWYAFIKMTKI